MLKVLMLDVDGVISLVADKIPGTDGYRVVNPILAARLARVIRETSAEIVVTSGWRQMIHDGLMSIEGMAALFRSHGIVSPQDRELGIKGLVHGVLPGGWKDGRKAARGELIRDYVAKLPQGTRVLIMDDQDFGYGGMEAKFVQTDETIGLTEADVCAAISYLNA